MDECDRLFIAYYQKVGRSYGMDELSSILFALLFLSPTEISLDELARQTGYSLASVSNKVRFLEGIGCILRKKKPGSKKAYFYAEKDVMKIVVSMMERMQTIETNWARAEIPAIISHCESEDASSETRAKGKILKKYLSDMKKFEKMVKVIQIFSRSPNP